MAYGDPRLFMDRLRNSSASGVNLGISAVLRGQPGVPMKSSAMFDRFLFLASSYFSFAPVIMTSVKLDHPDR